MKLSVLNKTILVCLFSFTVFPLSSQVTIGSGGPPAEAALLQLKDMEPDSDNATSQKGGLLLPRVKLENKTNLMPFIPDDNNFKNNVNNVKDKHKGLMVYNMNTSSDLETGIYIWEGTQWKLTSGGHENATANSPQDKYFYMPSFNLPLSTNSSEVLYVDLYAEYKKQFTKEGNDSFLSSDPSLTSVAPVYLPLELNYVITAYDNTLIRVLAISNDGILYYLALQPTAPEGSYINIVLVVK